MTEPRPFSVAHVTAERGFSGGEVQLFLLAEGLRKRGHANVLLCPAGSRSEEHALRLGLPTLPIRAAGWSPRAFASIGRALRAVAPDLVHLHTQRAAWLGGCVAWWQGRPAVATRRMDRAMKRNWRNRFVYGRAAGASVAISSAVARHLTGCGVPESRVRVIPSAVDPERLHPQRPAGEVRRELGAPRDAPCLLAVASLHRRKGLDVLLEALARLDRRDGPRPWLWIAGEGPERGPLERRVRERKLSERVRLLGRRGDVADLIAACDVCVLPSRREGLGVAALEAMALGRPLVASRVGGLAEAVEDGGTGLLVPPDDPGALADAIARLLRDPALRQRLGAAGPARIEARHSADAMVEAYERLYAELLPAPRSGDVGS